MEKQRRQALHWCWPMGWPYTSIRARATAKAATAHEFRKLSTRVLKASKHTQAARHEAEAKVRKS